MNAEEKASLAAKETVQKIMRGEIKGFDYVTIRDIEWLVRYSFLKGYLEGVTATLESLEETE